jgi:hypothetical protein
MANYSFFAVVRSDRAKSDLFTGEIGFPILALKKRSDYTDCPSTHHTFELTEAEVTRIKGEGWVVLRSCNPDHTPAKYCEVYTAKNAPLIEMRASGSALIYAEQRERNYDL